MANAADVASLQASRSNLIAVIQAQTAAWVADGCPPTFSIDGESYDWDSWLATKTDAIDKLTSLINRLSGPFMVRTLAR